MVAIMVATVVNGAPKPERFRISINDINEEAEKQMIQKASLLNHIFIGYSIDWVSVPVKEMQQFFINLQILINNLCFTPVQNDNYLFSFIASV